MATGFRELASVDGTITPTAEAMVPLQGRRPLPRRRRLRGDPPLRRAAVRARRPPRPARSARPPRSSSSSTAPRSKREIEALLAELGDGDGQLRLIVTRGGRRIAATEPLPPHGETLRLATVTYSPTVILNGVKSLSYAANMQATRLAKAQGADEAVLVQPDGTVLEPPTSAIFWVSPQGGLRTPALDDGVLESITRDRLVKALEVEEGAWPVADLRAAREAFLASTTREIQAVSAIDGTELRRGARPPHPRGPGGVRGDPGPGASMIRQRKQG